MTRVVGVAIAAAVVAADQVVKAIIRGEVPLGSSRAIVPGVDLVHTRNTGVSFGLLAGAPSWLVGLASAVALVLVVVIFSRLSPGTIGRLAAGLIVGGAIGNLIDRIALGSVTDFLDLPALPPCNLADVAITFGAIILIGGVLLTGDEASDELTGGEAEASRPDEGEEARNGLASADASEGRR